MLFEHSLGPQPPNETLWSVAFNWIEPKSCSVRYFCIRSMKTKTIHQISGWRRLVLWPLCLLLRLWSATIRVKVSPEELEIITRKDAPTIIITWHNRVFLVASVSKRFRKHRPISHLISASRDGAWLAAFFSLMGLVVVRGSSSQRTFGATRAQPDHTLRWIEKRRQCS